MFSIIWIHWANHLEQQHKHTGDTAKQLVPFIWFEPQKANLSSSVSHTPLQEGKQHGFLWTANACPHHSSTESEGIPDSLNVSRDLSPKQFMIHFHLEYQSNKASNAAETIRVRFLFVLLVFMQLFFCLVGQQFSSLENVFYQRKSQSSLRLPSSLSRDPACQLSCRSNQRFVDFHFISFLLLSPFHLHLHSSGSKLGKEIWHLNVKAFPSVCGNQAVIQKTSGFSLWPWNISKYLKQQITSITV